MNLPRRRGQSGWVVPSVPGPVHESPLQTAATDWPSTVDFAMPFPGVQNNLFFGCGAEAWVGRAGQAVGVVIGCHSDGIRFQPSAWLPPLMADPKTSTEWHARADEAKGVASRMQDPLARKTMLEIAAGYEHLASYADSAIARATTGAVAPVTSIDVYRSSNGDHWRLIIDTETGRRLVRHEPNSASGGQATDMTVEEFLAVNGPGPEYEALRRLLGRGVEQA